jgi:NAD(P)H-dependent FMN reductase
MTKILAIAGSYRKDGIIDQAIRIGTRQAQARGAEVEVVQLRDYPIEFCRNCRECTQLPGDAPGECVLRDGMRELIEKIEAADAFILASPTNVYAVTALFKRFMERLVVYSYWPWGAPAPKFRQCRATKKALVITSSAAPALIGRLFFGSAKGLKTTATLIGAKPMHAVCIGLAAKVPDARLGARDVRRIERAVAALV